MASLREIARDALPALLADLSFTSCFFVAQQAAKDSRQDQLLDNVTTKLVDISVALVAVKSGLEEMKVQQAREITLREERDRREMEELRRKRDGGK